MPDRFIFSNIHLPIVNMENIESKFNMLLHVESLSPENIIFLTVHLSPKITMNLNDCTDMFGRLEFTTPHTRTQSN